METIIQEKLDYILSQRDHSANLTSLSVDLDDETYNDLLNKAKDANMSPENLLYCILTLFFMEHQKKMILEKRIYTQGEEIIDMFEMYRAEELIKTRKTYVIATFKEPVVMIPWDKYQTLKGVVDE